MDEKRLEALKSEFHKEYPEFMEFLKTRGRGVLLGVLIAAVAVIGFRLFQGRGEARTAEAAAAYANAKSVDDLEKVITDFGSTPTAPLAYMSAGRAYFDAGDYVMAMNKYTDFLSKFPDHALAAGAELNRIGCLEAMDQTGEALTAYEGFAAGHPGHYLAAEALFGKSRCLERQGRPEEAKTVYEDYMVANPGGAWFARAEEALKEIDRQIEAKAKKDAGAKAE